jgi:hypothetical protein
MPDDSLDAAVAAVMQAIPDVITSAIRQDHGDPVNASPEEYIRAALAPHCPTVAVPDAAVEALWEAVALGKHDVALPSYFWETMDSGYWGLVDGISNEERLAKQVFRFALRASGVGVVPGRDALIEVFNQALPSVVGDSGPFLIWSADLADAVLNAIGGQRADATTTQLDDDHVMAMRQDADFSAAREDDK